MLECHMTEHLLGLRMAVRKEKANPRPPQGIFSPRVFRNPQSARIILEGAVWRGYLLASLK